MRCMVIPSAVKIFIRLGNLTFTSFVKITSKQSQNTKSIKIGKIIKLDEKRKQCGTIYA